MNFRYLVVFLSFFLIGAKTTPRNTVKNEYLIKLKPGAMSANFHSLGENVRRYQNFPDLFHKKLPPSTAQALLFYAQDIIEYIEPVYEVSIIDFKKEEDQKELAPDFSKQWGLENDDDTDVDALKAWEYTEGHREIIVAVIDTGVDYLHPDLANNIWINSDEIPGNNIDDDNNGYIDDIYGWNFNTATADPMDDHGHGTHCSGIIAAEGILATGAAPKVKIMSLKFLSASGSGSTADAIAAIDYGISNGAHILSNSWGGTQYSAALEEAIARASDADMLTVAAAGNYGDDMDVFPMYPGALDLPNMLTVANIDEEGSLHRSSNYSDNLVHLAAPGTRIYSTYVDNSYATLTGTSMAAPFVSAAGALLLSFNENLSVSGVKKYILNNTKPLDSLTGKTVSGGTLSIGNALEDLANGGDPGDPDDPNDEDPGDPDDPNDEDPEDPEDPEGFDPESIHASREISKRGHQRHYRVEVTLSGPAESYDQIEQVTYYYLEDADEDRESEKSYSPHQAFRVKFKTKMPTQYLEIKIRLANGDLHWIAR